MSTRGAIGFFVDGITKVAYNHSDSYPSELGKYALEFVARNKGPKLTEAVRAIVLVNEKTKPTAKQIEECKPWTNLNVGNQSTEDWYCLTREAQGDLGCFLHGLRYMLDARGYLDDSLFCEYAYIINCDTQRLEFYTGFNKTSTKGRYVAAVRQAGQFAKLVSDDYLPVALAAEFPLAKITTTKVKSFVSKMQKIVEKSRDE